MKILKSKKEKCLGVMFKNKAWTVNFSGYPLDKLWDNYWAVTLSLKMPCFYILKYEK